MDDANLVVMSHGAPSRHAVEGFAHGIAEMLCHQGYEGCGAANIDLPGHEAICRSIMSDQPYGRWLNDEGQVNIEIPLTAATEVLLRSQAAGSRSLHMAIVSDRPFTTVSREYEFIRASSGFLYLVKDGVLDDSGLQSPFYSALFLCAPSIQTADSQLEYDRARVLGMHEQMHVFIEGHCDSPRCLMTSGEEDGLKGGRRSNDELDAKVDYLRRVGLPYLCRAHNHEYRLDEHPKWVKE